MLSLLLLLSMGIMYTLSLACYRRLLPELKYAVQTCTRRMERMGGLGCRRSSARQTLVQIEPAVQGVSLFAFRDFLTDMPSSSPDVLWSTFTPGVLHLTLLLCVGCRSPPSQVALVAADRACPLPSPFSPTRVDAAAIDPVWWAPRACGAAVPIGFTAEREGQRTATGTARR